MVLKIRGVVIDIGTNEIAQDHSYNNALTVVSRLIRFAMYLINQRFATYLINQRIKQVMV